MSIVVMATSSFDDAYAATTISDQSSCESVSGVWNGGVTSCTLTTNLTEEIIMGINNLTLDCADFILDGSGAGIGISAGPLRNNVTIKNCEVTDFAEGISLESVFDSTISQNNLHNNTLGMRVSGSDNNMIFENTVNNNQGSGIFAGSSGAGSDFNTIKDNTTNQNGQIGIFWPFGSNNSFEGNTANQNVGAGFLIRSNGHTMTGNTANNNTNGIVADGLNTSHIGNTANFNTGVGIFVNKDSNEFVGNEVSGNAIGFSIRADNNTLNENTISSNTNTGIEIVVGSANTIFHNNIINNPTQASDPSPADNDWHNPILEEGNFWSDYPGVDDGSGSDKHAIAGDGIGDTQIPHPLADFDNFPFIRENGWEIIDSMPIGGTVGSMDTVSLLVAGAQGNMGLWIIALVGVVAVVGIAYKAKTNKTNKETL